MDAGRCTGLFHRRPCALSVCLCVCLRGATSGFECVCGSGVRELDYRRDWRGRCIAATGVKAILARQAALMNFYRCICPRKKRLFRASSECPRANK